MSDAYGFLAPIYQPISRLVFGKDLIYANQAYLEGVLDKKLLIIGGGDGLAYKGFERNMGGEFWDLSPRMTQLAKRNLEALGLKIQIGAWPGTGKFDRIYLPFVLDTLSNSEIQELLSQIKSALLPQGQVIVSDFFEPVTWGQQMIQKAMIQFFQTFAAHQQKDLPDLEAFLKKGGFELIEEKNWRKGWIKAQVWKPV